jgi:hypothetical protein
MSELDTLAFTPKPRLLDARLVPDRDDRERSADRLTHRPEPNARRAGAGARAEAEILAARGMVGAEHRCASEHEREPCGASYAAGHKQ